MSDYLDPNNEELLKDFFVEAQLQVDLLEQNILVLENDPANRDAVDEIFRASHTLKGASGAVQMDELTGFTHLLEDVLDEIRGGSVAVDGGIVDTLLASVDIIKNMLDHRREGGVFGENISGVRDSLAGCLPGRKRDAAAPSGFGPSKPQTVPKQEKAGSLSEYDILEMRSASEPGSEVYRIDVSFDENNPMNTVGGIQVFARLKGLGQVMKTEPDFEKLYEDTFFPTVVYYLASRKETAEIRGALDIPDVVTGTRIEALPGAAELSGAASASVPAPTPAPQAPPPAPPRVRPAAKGPAAEEAAAHPVEEQAGTGEGAAAEARPAEHADGKTGPRSQGSILRVDSGRIDNLLNLVSETVITKAALNQVSNLFQEHLAEFRTAKEVFAEKMRELFDSLPRHGGGNGAGGSGSRAGRERHDRHGELLSLFDSFESRLKSSVAKFRGSAQNLGRITGELQEGVMRIRMVPISQIFSRFPRLVRDLSRSLSKRIDLVIEGEDTELDKSVIEDLLDPLIHCVRNSIDHGIEDADARRAAGKPEEGRVLLKASNEGNLIVIQIADDGRGIDVEQIRRKAVERGLIHPDKNLSDVEAYNLIFEPGFSTTKTVTSISGRGVGLDVVRRQIEKLSGSVVVSSDKGRGTRFVIKLPLTLAIIQGLLVRVGKEKYVIPISSVVDSHRIRPADIKLLGNYEVFDVRDDVVPIMRLNRLFRIPTEENADHHYVVIVGSGDTRMGLIVDSLIGEEDVVIKPLRGHFTGVPGIAGANITGDGSVSLIIDVPQLLDLGLKKEIENRRRREAPMG